MAHDSNVPANDVLWWAYFWGVTSNSSSIFNPASTLEILWGGWCFSWGFRWKSPPLFFSLA